MDIIKNPGFFCEFTDVPFKKNLIKNDFTLFVIGDNIRLRAIKDEIDVFIDYLEQIFGKDKMPECKAYLLRLKKTI